MDSEDGRRAEVDRADAASVVRVLQSHARAGRQGDALQPLQDRLQWNQTPPAAQDYVTELAGERLGEGWRRVKTSVYECGGERHRIATFEHEASGIPLNLIPGGTYLMGSESGSFDEKPAHRVMIPPLWVGVTAVTQGQWDAIGGEDERKWRGATLPIEGVSWVAARAWLERLGGGLRLLSESEWEYACRGGTLGEWCYGDDVVGLGDYAWYELNSGDRTHAVGGKRANAFGLHDMHGNVDEWCEDDYFDSYEAGPTDHTPRTAGRTRDRVNRGGNWGSDASSTRSADRYGCGVDDRDELLGFRVARSLG